MKDLMYLDVERFCTIKHNPLYEVSTFGRIRNIKTSKILKPSTHSRKGRNKPTKYLRIELKSPRKKYLVHRLVAEAFIPNPENKPQVNHIDEDGNNNIVCNLEWCTNEQNCIYSQAKKVQQLSLNGIMLSMFISLTEASKQTGSDFRLISAVCLGKRKTHNGFIWKYV